MPTSQDCRLKLVKVAKMILRSLMTTFEVNNIFGAALGSTLKKTKPPSHVDLDMIDRVKMIRGESNFQNCFFVSFKEMKSFETYNRRFVIFGRRGRKKF